MNAVAAGEPVCVAGSGTEGPPQTKDSKYLENTPVTTQIALREDERMVITPAATLSVKEIQGRALQIQQLMQSMMKPNVHFGIVPGCKSPSLYKAGSELLLTMFRIAVDPIVEDLSDAEHIRYRVRCRGLALDGSLVGVGIGECSTAEEKYSYRKAVCDEEFKAADPLRQRVKWGKDKSGKTYSVNQVRMNPSDLANTVLKMAKKRAQIDMCLTALGASDIFAQDLEELTEEIRDHVTAGEDTHEPIKQPQSKTAATAAQMEAKANAPTQRIDDLTPPASVAAEAGAAPAKDPLDLEAVGVVEFVKDNPGKKDGREWIRYGIKLNNGEWFNTFDGKLGGFAKEAKAKKLQVIIRYRTSEHGNEIIEIIAAG